MNDHRISKESKNTMLLGRRVGSNNGQVDSNFLSSMRDYRDDDNVAAEVVNRESSNLGNHMKTNSYGFNNKVGRSQSYQIGFP